MCRGSRKDFRKAVVAARKAAAGMGERQRLPARPDPLPHRGNAGRAARPVHRRARSCRARRNAPADTEVDAAIDRLDLLRRLGRQVPAGLQRRQPGELVALQFLGARADRRRRDRWRRTTAACWAWCPTSLRPSPAAIPAWCWHREAKPLCAVTFAEVLHASDVPGGVVNILTGFRGRAAGTLRLAHGRQRDRLLRRRAGRSRAACRNSPPRTSSALSQRTRVDWTTDDAQHPYLIRDTQEVKTTWHPIGT